MAEKRIVEIDIGAEVDRLFDPTSLSDGERPRIVLIMGGVAAGKTTFRKENYATGYVLVDAADIHLSLSRGEFYPFPVAFEEPMDLIGRLVARRAVGERRHIVTELIGADLAPLKRLIDAMKGAGYDIVGQRIECDVDVAWERNVNRGDDDISAYFAEPFQRRWLIEAAEAGVSPHDFSGRTGMGS